LDMVGMLVAIYSCMDLMKAGDTAENWMVAALIANWGVDQLIDNAMMVNIGNQVTEYIKLDDGTDNGVYVPPPGITTNLIKNNDGTFTLQERFGTKMNFNSDKKISSIVDADGNTATFEYNEDKTLNTVTDEFGRYIKLNYTSGKITSVSDFASGSATPMRTVSYSYDTTNNNLTGYTDAEGKQWGYGYSTPSNHLMTTLTNPLSITTATNTYDSLGRVETQTVPRQGGGAVTYNFYFSGYRNQEEDPNGKTITYYYDKKGRAICDRRRLGQQNNPNL